MKEYILKVAITTPEGITHEEIDRTSLSSIIKYDRDVSMVLEGKLNALVSAVVDLIFEGDE